MTPDIQITQALLQWYRDMGVDECTSSTPTDWMAAPPPVQVAAEPKPSGPAVIASISPADIQSVMEPASATGAVINASLAATLAEARELAGNASSLPQLEAAIRSFEGCALKKMAKNTVFCDGQPDADIMFIGEAPGADEDAQGIPFCGISGRLLDEMMKAIGLSRQTNAYITNTLFWRPPGNRTPTPDELAICLPFVEKHIALFKPKLIIMVGGTATKALLDDKAGITRLRGKPLKYKNQYLDADIPVRAIFHPSYLLRQPAQKALVWNDLLEIKQVMGALPSSKLH